MEMMKAFQDDLNAGTCPVCRCSFGKKRPRESVQSHLRGADDPAHKAWMNVWYRATCPHGRFRTPPVAEPLAIDVLYEQLKTSIGEQALRGVAMRVLSC